MVENRARDRNTRWRSVGDKLARNRVARWVIRGARSRALTRRTPRTGRSLLVRTLAWSVHLYTALGAVAAAGMLVLLVRGDASAFRGTFLLMLVACLIDATDGTLARRIRVKEVLPGFDGRRLDDLVDWLTYTCLPLMLIWRAEILPPGQEVWLIVPLLASAYGFCQTSIKTDDGYFLGFPSLWNIVAFYLYVLDLPGSVALGIILLLSALTFVPSRYLYPSSRPGLLNKISNIGAAFWSLLLAWIFWSLPGVSSPGHRVPDGFTRALVLASTLYPLWYLGASWAVTFRFWWGRRTRVRSLPVDES
ncbi:MAG: phosphatidylserine synthase [Planctomycetota bacterium]|nr:phosphatidylserine synthase [Planctomycetota bacterium]